MALMLWWDSTKPGLWTGLWTGSGLNNELDICTRLLINRGQRSH